MRINWTIQEIRKARRSAAAGELEYTPYNAAIYKYIRFIDWRIYCDICQKNCEDNIHDGERVDLCVDHDHIPKHNHIRGLLCSKCNTGLGFFQDQIEFLNAAAVYVKERDYGVRREEEPYFVSPMLARALMNEYLLLRDVPRKDVAQQHALILQKYGVQA